MEWILILLVLGLMALFFFRGISSKAGGNTLSDNPLGYRKKKALFSEAERSFLGVLDQCLDPTQYRVFGKVRVADIVEPNPTRCRSEWQKAFNSINAKHFDYVICSRNTLKPVFAVELDDKSHNQKKRQQRDELLDGVCKDAGLLLLRFPAQRSYNPKVINAVLAQRLAAVSPAKPEKVYSATRTATPASGENVASQLLGKDKFKPATEVQSQSEGVT